MLRQLEMTARCGAAVPGCEFPHRPGACACSGRRDAAVTRRRGHLRYGTMTTVSDISQPPDDDLPPHLDSPEASTRWCSEHPEEVRHDRCSADVLGCEFPHRLGACACNRRRDAAVTRRRDACATGGRMRYGHE